MSKIDLKNFVVLDNLETKSSKTYTYQLYNIVFNQHNIKTKTDPYNTTNLYCELEKTRKDAKKHSVCFFYLHLESMSILLKYIID